MPDDNGGQEPPEENVEHIRPVKKARKFDAHVLEVGRKLRQHPELHEGKLLRYDTFAGEIMLMHPIPRPGLPLVTRFEPRPIADVDIIHLIEWLIASGAKKPPSVSTVQMAVTAEAHRNQFSSAREALDRLPAWDGVYRLEAFCTKVLKAESAEPGMSEVEVWKRSRYLAAVGKSLFLSIVARILEPGCQSDAMVILEGKQGTFKSSLLKILAFDRDQWFSDSMPADLSSKDARIHLNGRLIIELGELVQFRDRRVDVLKRFISSTHDKYRPPFSKTEASFARQCTLVGTTNEDLYLTDPTGNRRYWPVKCGLIDLDQARKEIQQLYAEALAAYHKGERWHLSDDLVTIAEAEQAARESEDAWHEPASDMVAERRREAQALGEMYAWVRTIELLRKVLHPDKHDRAAMMRAAEVLKKLGGVSKKVPLKMGRGLQGYRFDLGAEVSEAREVGEDKPLKW
jgi:predicted P-loop ATPase